MSEPKIIVDFGETATLSDEQAPRPRVQWKAFLAVLSVCLVYVAQNYAIVGAGAVSLWLKGTIMAA
jgi:hypothetical protein